MRPIYESTSDQQRERAVFRILEGCWNVQIVKAPRLSPWDAEAHHPDGRFAGYVEVKCRNKKYPELMISSHKVRDLHRAAGTTKAPGLLVVRWGEAAPQYIDVGGINLDDLKHAPGGRVDRGDHMDTEDCVFIPVGRFVPCSFSPFTRFNRGTR